MVGTSPVERGHQKDQAALFWLWRWGWSTATTTDLAVSKSRGVVKRLVDRGLIEYYGTEGYRSKYYPARVTVLTKAGASLAGETNDLGELRRPTAEHVAWHQLAHDHAAQMLTATMLSRGEIIEFTTPRERGVYTTKGMKRPDAFWVLKDGAKVALEVEMSPKKQRELHGMVLKMEALLLGGSVDRVMVFTQSRALGQHLTKLIQPGANRVCEEAKVSSASPDWLASRIEIKPLP